MPLACTGTMQKALRISVQKQTTKEQPSPSDTDALWNLPVSTSFLCMQLAPKGGSSVVNRTRVILCRGSRAGPCRCLVPVADTLLKCAISLFKFIFTSQYMT